VMYGEYQLLGAEASVAGRPIGFAGSLGEHREPRFLSAAYSHGPSLTLDTTRPSSLTSAHLACQDLRHGRIELGIAGGVNVTIHPNKYRMLSAGGFISAADAARVLAKVAAATFPEKAWASSS